MSLQFIFGNSGFGKTTMIYEKIIRESMEHPEWRYYCIVPEQFTLQTQRDFVNMHPRKGISNIDVLSFQRLAFHVLDEVGENGRMVLEETGKNIVLRKLAKEQEEKLTVLGRNLKKLGYISEVKSLISELTQYQVTPEILEELIRKTGNRDLLSRKLQDVQLLYRAFLDYMGEEYMTSEQVLQVLNEVLERSAKLKDSIIVLDGFTAFSPVQLRLVQGLTKTTKKVYLTVTLDTREEPYSVLQKTDLFYLSKKMIQSVTAAAKEAGVTLEVPVLCNGKAHHRFTEHEDLLFLEQHLFRSGKAVYTEKPVHIHMKEYRTAMDEITGTAVQIRRLVRENGYRYGEIAVVLGSMDYQEHISRVFNRFEIPAFLDEKRNALSHPFVEFIRALLKMIEENFSYETVFRYLRSGFSGISTEETDLLENYCLALGIRGIKKYSEKWIRFAKGQTDAELGMVNAVREKFYDSLKDTAAVLKDKNTTITKKCTALYEFMERLQLEQQLAIKEAEFLEQGEGALSKEYHQIFRVIMELLEKYVELLGEECIPLEEFSELLDAGFEEVKVGIIPPGSDRVVVGDMERTRLKDVKVLFLLGVNEGNIPKSLTGGGILSQMEREFLEEQNATLAPTAKEQVYLQKFYLYYVLTKASKQLYLSYAATDFHGAALRPSYLKEVFEKLFAGLKTEKYEPDTLDTLETTVQGLDYLTEALSAEEKDVEELRQLMAWYEESPEFQAHFEKLWKQLIKGDAETTIGQAVAKAVYGEGSAYSVTRLEKYATCAYAHFLQYGLRLKEREVYEFVAVDMGNLLHSAVELFARKVDKGPYDWFGLKEDDRERLAEESVDEVITDYRNTLLFDSARNEYMIARMRRLVKRAVWALTEQIKMGVFVPEKLEAPFYVKDAGISLHGRIDRIDTYEEEDKVYVRVMDYKSGAASFDLTALYNGLQLQLAVYLNAAVAMEKKDHTGKTIIPAGLLYFPMKDPMISSEAEMNEQQLEESIFKELSLEGVCNADSDIIHYMDRTCDSKSKILPIAYNKDGSLSKTSKAVSTEQFEQLEKFVAEKCAQLGAEIMEGKISVNPYGTVQKTACDYCSYNGICGFSPKESSYRKLEKFQWE
ncbi:MAG: helicase-exonuclease AddAB subunit AddB [Lachnospiraceae bacterium]|nr:helicase-exonuclease AddAB subunit AddB [Lachnospiraceae bacterium]